MNYKKAWQSLKKAYIVLSESKGDHFKTELGEVLQKMVFIEQCTTSDHGSLKEDSIQTIEGLYPPDCQYEDTAAIGRRLLQQAKDEVENWRNLPEEVLVRFALLCERHDELETGGGE